MNLNKYMKRHWRESGHWVCAECRPTFKREWIDEVPYGQNPCICPGCGELVREEIEEWEKSLEETNEK